VTVAGSVLVDRHTDAAPEDRDEREVE